MIKSTEDQTLSFIRDYLTVYMPKQRKMSPNTILAYRIALNQYIDFLEQQHSLKIQDISMNCFTAQYFQGFSDWLYEQELAVVSVSQKFMAIQSFLKYVSARMPEYIYHLNEARSIPHQKEEKKPVDYMSEESVKKLFQQPDASDKKELRDLVIMVMLYDTAARVNELLGIKLYDLSLGQSPSVVLYGKGRKIRSVPLMKNTVVFIQKYMTIYHPGADTNTDVPLFYTIINGHKGRMSDDNIRRMLDKYVKRAKENGGFEFDRIHPHMWRHTRAMHLYQHGMDLSMISQWLGHSSPTVTQVYAYADIEMKREAIIAASSAKTSVDDADLMIDKEETLRRLYGLK